jgi:hypothetical protein
VTLLKYDRSGSIPPTKVDQQFHRYGMVGHSPTIADVIRRIELA